MNLKKSIEKRYLKHLRKIGRAGKNKKKFKTNKPIGNGLKKIERSQRANLKISPTKYLKQDVGLKGISSKAIVLKITNKNPNTPYEHLTFKRIDAIL